MEDIMAQFKITLNDIPLEYDYKTINMFYNEYLNVLNNAPFEIIQIHPIKLGMKSYNPNRKWIVQSKEDLYLDKYKSNKLGLAKDIKKNGMLFPFYVYLDDGAYYIHKGIHKYSQIYKLKTWGIRKVSCLVINPESDYAYRLENSITELSELILPTKIKTSAPVFNYGANNWYIAKYGNIINTSELDTFDKSYGIIDITITSYNQYYNLLIMWEEFLSRIIFYNNYQTKNIKIKGMF